MIKFLSGANTLTGFEWLQEACMLIIILLFLYPSMFSKSVKKVDFLGGCFNRGIVMTLYRQCYVGIGGALELVLLVGADKL